MADNDNDPPYEVAQTTMEVMGMTVRVAVLNTGQRVIYAEDFDKLMEAMASD